MRNLRFWFPVFLYSAIIFVISSLPSQEITFTVIVWDKFLHVIEYAILGLLLARALVGTRQWPYLTVWTVTVVLCYLYGLTDEFHQGLTPGREASIGDALADFLGGAVGAGIYPFVQQCVSKLKKEDVAHVSP